MTSLGLIKQLGFRHIGEWRYKNGSIFAEIEPAAMKTKWVLYAFVRNQEICYIGKTAMPFGRRLAGYRNPGSSQKTNLRINPKVTNLVRSNKRVLIYLFEGARELNFKGIKLNLAAALEDPLIRKFSPPWNLNGRQKSVCRTKKTKT